MILRQHSHPVSGRNYRVKQLSTTDKILTGATLSSGNGFVTIELGRSVDSTNQIPRNLNLSLTEHEAMLLIIRLQDNLATILKWKVEQMEEVHD